MSQLRGAFCASAVDDENKENNKAKKDNTYPPINWRKDCAFIGTNLFCVNLSKGIATKVRDIFFDKKKYINEEKK
ncbi:hypothetical protein GCM10011514_52010 [Emticicia aquatilis]|uniref:Uncharacterized protein n=1 Tax=Emticicia aquatilis TaxID=1537369 RepID=A0A916Z8W3_9BACT|nr:hypothetical protein GCM10011514_52010 [Emticicia aquatilis]